MTIRVPRLTTRQAGSFANLEEVQVWAHEKDEESRQIILALGDTSRDLQSLSRSSTETTSLGKHAASHLPGGSDALATAAPSNIGSANSEGTSSSFARADHIHAGVADLTGGTNINVSAAVGSVTINLDSSISLTDATLSAATPVVLTNASPDIDFGVTDSGSANILTFQDRNTNAAGKLSASVDFINGNSDTLRMVVGSTEVSFTVQTANVDLAFTTQGTGDIKFSTGTGDIELDANAAVKWTGAAVLDFGSNTAITLGQSAAGASTTWTIKDTSAANESNITFTMGTFAAAAKIAHDFPGSFAGNAGDDLEIECTLGNLLLNAAASHSIVLNDDAADVDTVVKGDTDTDLIHVDASADRVGFGLAAPTGKVHIDQSSSSGAIPVLHLDQADVSEEFIRLTGQAASATLTQSLVDVGDVASFTAVGYLKVNIQDEGNQITDGAYYIEFGTLA